MNAIEEKLWNYIDGNCTAEEQNNIIALIDADDTIKLKYQELLNLNKQFAAMELDEPPMAFTYNIMEAIRTENALTPLKASISKKMVQGITAFFLLTIMSLMLYAVMNSVSFSSSAPYNGAAGFRLPDLSNFKIKPLMEGFVFFDIVMALYIFDIYLRKNVIRKQQQ